MNMHLHDEGIPMARGTKRWQGKLRRMRARDRGTIVQVSSALAYRSIPLQSAGVRSPPPFQDPWRGRLAARQSGNYSVAATPQ